MEVSKVMMFGANKYGDHNYKSGLAWTRLLDASLRHTYKFIDGIDNDHESNLSHLAHAAANNLMLLEYTIYELGEDDRYKK